MSEDIRKRFKDVLADKSLNITRISGRGTPLRTKLDRQLNYGAAITTDVILALANAVPELSMDWLIKGEGEPYLPLRERVITEEEADTLAKLVERVATIENQLRSIR